MDSRTTFSTVTYSQAHTNEQVSSSPGSNNKNSFSQEQRVKAIFQQQPPGHSSPSLLVTAKSMRFPENCDEKFNSRRLSDSTNSDSNHHTNTSSSSSSSIPYVEEGAFTEVNLSHTISETFHPPYQYLGWPSKHPISFSSYIQMIGFKARRPGETVSEDARHNPLESDENYDKRTLLDYQISSIRVPMGGGTSLPFPIHSLLSTNPKTFYKSIESLVYRWNQELLAEARVQLLEEVSSSKDPISVEYSSEAPPGFVLCQGTQNTAIAIAQAIGRRDCQEDVCSEGCFEFKDKKVSYVALFDGHGSIPREDAYPSLFCTREMIRFVLQRLSIETGEIESSYKFPFIRDALTLAFVDLSRSYRHSINNTRPGVGGSTANAAFMIDNRLWIANVGDSRAMLVGPGGEQIALSVDARPNNPRFKKEVEERGGSVNAEGTRVGTLAITRAIGDHHVLGVSARADVCFVDSPKEGWKGWYLVQTCDGIHEEKIHSKFSKTVAMSSKEVGNIVYLRTKVGKNLSEIAKEIVEKAYRRGSKDNLSVVITPMDSL